MPAVLHMAGASSGTLLVKEDPEEVARVLADASGVVTLTRKEGYSDPAGVEGQPVWVNSARVAYFTAA